VCNAPNSPFPIPNSPFPICYKLYKISPGLAILVPSLSPQGIWKTVSPPIQQNVDIRKLLLLYNLPLTSRAGPSLRQKRTQGRFVKHYTIGQQEQKVGGLWYREDNTYVLGYSQTRLRSVSINKQGEVVVSGCKGEGRSKRNVGGAIAIDNQGVKPRKVRSWSSCWTFWVQGGSVTTNFCCLVVFDSNLLQFLTIYNSFKTARMVTLLLAKQIK
jgi:hypothetical protein